MGARVAGVSVVGVMIAAIVLSTNQRGLSAQESSPRSPQGLSKVCTIYFDKDVRRPAQVEDSAQECLLSAKKMLLAQPATQLYLVATADSKKDNTAGHGRSRTEQDMTGEDLRYADVAAYRAINTKAYMVQWIHLNPKRIVPLTSYESGQWLEVYLVPRGVSFKSVYEKKTAPILERPCTVSPCPSGYEEFLIAQHRGAIPK